MARFCPSCGAKLDGPGVRFCPSCGSPAAADGEQPTRSPERPRRGLRTALVAVFLAILAAAVSVLLLASGSADEDNALPSPRELPAGTVAVVVESSSSRGTITRPEFAHALEQAAAQADLEQTPIPGDDEYAELRETALNDLVENAWLEGQAEEMGISVSKDEVADRLRTVKGENFEDEGEYRKFVEEARFTRADLDSRVLLEILSTRIQKRLKRSVPAPSEGEVEHYYARNEATQFTADGGQVEPLWKVRSQIRSQLAAEAEQEAFNRFVRSYNRRWRARTVCAPGFVTEYCSNGPRPAPLLPDAVPQE